MDFIVDQRIASTSFVLGEWPLSQVLLKNNASYPWFILVPRLEGMEEIEQLPRSMQHQLMDEISQLSAIVRTYFNPHKLNIAALGNIVKQLHVHVVARFTEDPLWPHAIWQAGQTETPYDLQVLNPLLAHFREQVGTHLYSGKGS